MLIWYKLIYSFLACDVCVCVCVCVHARVRVCLQRERVGERKDLGCLLLTIRKKIIQANLKLIVLPLIKSCEQLLITT